jgi:hypothetical protein
MQLHLATSRARIANIDKLWSQADRSAGETKAPGIRSLWRSARFDLTLLTVDLSAFNMTLKPF